MKRMIVMLFASMLGCTLFASLSDGLVVYYPLDGNADDASGYVNNGTTDGVRSVSDRNGNENSALAFDGDIRWSNENHWTDENGEMTARNFSKDDSTICISQGGRFFLSARGSGTLTFNARGSQDGFFYVKDGESLGNYVRNSTDFTMRSITLTGNEDEWHTILWATYEDGYLGTHAWGEIKDFSWNGQTIEFPFEYPNEDTEYWQIAFDANGGLIDDWDTVRYIEIEDGVTFADAIGDLPTPGRMGYDFKGWFTEKNGGTQIYDTATATADVTYYAHWEANDEGCVVDGTRWFYQDCGELDGIEIIGIAGTIPTSLVIPTELNDKKVVAIGAYSLYRSSWGEVKSTLLDGVVSLTLNEGLKRIGRGAFEGCLFRSAYIPSTLETIESFAFNECSNLTSVTISEGVCALNECCFGSCKALSEITLPSSVTNLERAIFQDCYSLTNVVLNCAKPSLLWYGEPFDEDDDFNDILCQVPVATTRFYVRNTCGWKDANGNRLDTWFGRAIIYDPIPSIGDKPTTEDISEALEGSTDGRLATHIANGSAYNAYRAWAERVRGSDFAKRQAVKDSAHAWLTFALDSNALITNAPKQGDVKIDTFKSSATIGAFDFEVSVKDIAVGDGATATNLAEIFGIEGSSTPDGDYSSSGIDLTFGTPNNGKVKCTARPKDATEPSFFMRVKMNP